MNTYQVIGLIGEGAYGVVLKARHRDTKTIVAIKKFKETDDDQMIKKTTGREIKVLRSLKHKNIVQLQQAFKKKGLVHLVFEYLDNNLLEVLEKNPLGLSNKQIAKYLYQVLEGLAYMHSNNYIHRDVKPENLLVTSDGKLKICDMGFANNIQDVMTDYVATRWYRPIELLIGTKYGTAIDIWAVGCIFAELSDSQPLFPGHNEVDQLCQILSCLGNLPDCFLGPFKNNPLFQNVNLPEVKNSKSLDRYRSKLTDKGVDLLKRMLALDPEKRISAADALKHPYFDIVRPRKERVQKTYEQWHIPSQATNIMQSYTQRNSRHFRNIQRIKEEISQELDMERDKSEEGCFSTNKISKLFKFGYRKCKPINACSSNILDSQMKSRFQPFKESDRPFKETERILKENDRNHLILGLERKSLKGQTMVGHRTNGNIKILQKKSNFMSNS